MFMLKHALCLLQLINLQESLRKSETQIDQLNSQILTMWQEKDVHFQESATHQKMLQQSQEKVNKDLYLYLHLYTYLQSFSNNKK